MPSVLITGANRGLGLEFARQYAADGWRVIATCRDPAEAAELRGVAGDVRVDQLDMRDAAAIAGFAARLGTGGLDLLIANAGRMGPGHMASKADAADWLETLAVNAVAPTLLAAALAPAVIAAKGKLVAITSRMGSIADNESGGYIAYRSSKAALNAAWRSLAIDLGSAPVAVAMLHPGWVQTDMGGKNAPLDPPASVASMRRTIAKLGPDDKGVFLNHDGEELPW